MAQFIVSLLSYLLGRGTPMPPDPDLSGWVQNAVLILLALAFRNPAQQIIPRARTIIVCAVFAAVGALGALVLFMSAFHAVRAGFVYKAPDVFQPAPLAALLSAAAYAIMSEWIFRGVLIDAIRSNGASEAQCVIAPALAWGLTATTFDHGLLQALLQCLFGIVLGVVRIRTGQLVYAMALHVGYNVSLIGFSTLP